VYTPHTHLIKSDFTFSLSHFCLPSVFKGERIAQLICEKIEYPDLEEVEELEDSERGEKGFGSTGH
jgi:putative dUTP diphosphatase